MGQERVFAILPWIVFAAVDRYGGQGTTWGAIGALIATITILAVERDNNSGVPNVLMIGATIWFSGLALAGMLYESHGNWLAQNGRFLSAAGLTVIAAISLAYIPFTEHYTRPHTRPSHWTTDRFRHVNVVATMLWAGVAALAATAQWVAPIVNQRPAYTVLNWVVPIALLAIGSHYANQIWEQAFDDENEPSFDCDLLWDLNVEMAKKPAHDDI